MATTELRQKQYSRLLCHVCSDNFFSQRLMLVAIASEHRSVPCCAQILKGSLSLRCKH